MSLSPATKDISSKPGKDAVTDPTDKDMREKDVDRKVSQVSLLYKLTHSI